MKEREREKEGGRERERKREGVEEREEGRKREDRFEIMSSYLP